jgi:hypothetical protein
LPIGGNVLLVHRTGAVNLGLSQAIVEERLSCANTGGPKAAEHREPVPNTLAFKAARSVYCNSRIISGLGDANLRVGRSHRSLSGGDVGPPHQEFFRHAARNYRGLRNRRSNGERKIRRRFPEQNRKGVLRLGALHLEIDGLRLRGFELSLSLEHVAARRDACVVAVVGQLQRFLKGAHTVIEHPFLRVQGFDEKIILRHLGARAQSGRYEVCGAGLSACLIGFYRAPDPAPDIEFPRNINRQ